MFSGEGVFELQGVMDTYKNWVHGNWLAFSGPTNFAPFLRHFNHIARKSSK